MLLLYNPVSNLSDHPFQTLTPNSKALIRKHYLSNTITTHLTKHPTSLLSSSSAITCELELDYAEYLYEALAEAYELRDSLGANEGKEEQERQWWILKPGMSDRGQGIRLFSSLEELEAVFGEFEESDESEEETEGGEGDGGGVKVRAVDTAANSGYNRETSVVTSQLRHFVAQNYIHPPLLIHNKKFHIRAYVLAIGGLKVYVYRHMLALFAAKEYLPPWEESSDLTGHLTNTCLQTGEREGSVQLFWELEKDILNGEKALETVWGKIKEIVGEIWEAAARGMRVHFQTIPNAFEIFGVDFLVDADKNVFLLEVNSYPDFKQTGEELSRVIDGLFEGVVGKAVKPFFDGKQKDKVLEEPRTTDGEEDERDMVMVLDIDLGNW